MGSTFIPTQLPVATSTIQSPPSSIYALIQDASIRYEISFDKLYSTLKCESKLNPKAIGDHGKSFGVAQIHLPSHPTITKKQALDPVFAVNWSAKMFSQGKANLWSCYRALYD